MTTAPGSSSPARSPSTTTTCSRSTDSVTNNGSAAVASSPFGRITRVGEPQVSGYWILHEGLIGVLGDKGLQEYKYKDIQKDHEVTWNDVTGGWLGITDKYWAAALIPEQTQTYTGALHRQAATADAGLPDRFHRPRPRAWRRAPPSPRPAACSPAPSR